MTSVSTSQKFSLKWNNYSHHLISAFDDFRENDDLTDVTLSCEGKRLKAHKLVLSACSLYFKETFRDNPCKHPVIILNGVTLANLEAVVSFIYNGQVNVSQDHLPSFLQTAELLQIKGLADINDSNNSNSNVSTTESKKSAVVSPVSNTNPNPATASASEKGNKSTLFSENSDSNSESVPVRPPSPKRKRIGPASYLKSLSKLNSAKTRSQESSKSSQDTNLSSSPKISITNVSGSVSVADEGTSESPCKIISSSGITSGISSSTGGLLNPQTVLLPPAQIMGQSEGNSNSNSNDCFSQGIIKYEDEDADAENDMLEDNLDLNYEDNNLAENSNDLTNEMDDDPNSMLTGLVHVETTEGNNINNTSIESSWQESILPYEILQYPQQQQNTQQTASSAFFSPSNSISNFSSLQVPAKNRVLLLRRKAPKTNLMPVPVSMSLPMNLMPIIGNLGQSSSTSSPTKPLSKRKSTSVPRLVDISESDDFMGPAILSDNTETWFPCNLCDKRYKVRSSLDSHLKIHQGEIAKCDFCGQVMSRMRDLKRHIATVHRSLQMSGSGSGGDDLGDSFNSNSNEEKFTASNFAHFLQ